mmetsp:Transcript_7745/g.11284  ORF Transcript_7745/g.11284 Transcript_7745/m.11284 type:complete len:164 (+) Transcript_7745:87-578(+)
MEDKKQPSISLLEETDTSSNIADGVHQTKYIPCNNYAILSSNSPPKNVSKKLAKWRQTEDDFFSLCQTQRRDSLDQRHEVQIQKNEPKYILSESSPLSDGEETEEEMQASHEADMTMIKGLLDTLQMLEILKENLKQEYTVLSDEVTDLIVEREIRIDERRRL